MTAAQMLSTVDRVFHEEFAACESQRRAERKAAYTKLSKLWPAGFEKLDEPADDLTDAEFDVWTDEQLRRDDMTELFETIRYFRAKHSPLDYAQVMLAVVQADRRGGMIDTKA